jgi:hypothetical protein
MSERLLGTPIEKMWAGVKSLKDWHEYPKWQPMNLASKVPNLSPSGLDLLSVRSSISVKTLRFVTFKLL